jgi:predicted PurR-regulated permease PerM
MDVRPHLRTTGSALKNWFIATLQDAAAVGAMWFIGLLILRVPLAFVWAIIGGACQFIPNFGPLIAVIGPALTTLFASESDAFMHLLYVFILYAVIAVIDGLVLQPYLMKRSNKVPIWASILAPIMLGIVIPFWGVLLAPPLLAVIYAYRGKRLSQSSPR